jgi:hypothetical protein
MRTSTMTIALLAGTTLAGCQHRRTEPESSMAPAPIVRSDVASVDTVTTYSSSASYNSPMSSSSAMSSAPTRTTGMANGTMAGDMRSERREVRSGITALERARRELEASKTDFGGRRGEATKAVDAALKELRMAGGQETRDARTGTETRREERVEGKELHLALADLERARADMDHATHNFNGRRTQALAAVDTAIKEIRRAAEHER